MMARLARWRFVTLLLLLATPGLGGAALQALHPCPAQAPWADGAGHDAAADGAHVGHGAGSAAADHLPAGDHGPSEHTDDCHCVGACLGAVAAVAAAPELPSVALGTPPAAPMHPVVRRVAAAVPLELLPPATAPPLI